MCSRNLEIERNDNNGYWQVAKKYFIEENLPEGIAVQWETCGPKIQSNPMGLSEIDGFVFSGYNIPEHRYLEFHELIALRDKMKFKMVKIIDKGPDFCFSNLDYLGEGKYENGYEREGVVVRSQHNVGHKPISFKVINLNYEN